MHGYEDNFCCVQNVMKIFRWKQRISKVTKGCFGGPGRALSATMTTFVDNILTQLSEPEIQVGKERPRWMEETKKEQEEACRV